MQASRKLEAFFTLRKTVRRGWLEEHLLRSSDIGELPQAEPEAAGLNGELPSVGLHRELTGLARDVEIFKQCGKMLDWKETQGELAQRGSIVEEGKVKRALTLARAKWRAEHPESVASTPISHRSNTVSWPHSNFWRSQQTYVPGMRRALR